MGSQRVRDLTADQFHAEIQAGKGLTVVDFWAEWCGPCRSLAPILESVAEHFAGRIRFTKANVDHNRELAKTLGIRSIPCLVVFDGAKELGRIVGLVSKVQLQEALEKIENGHDLPGGHDCCGGRHCS